MVQPLPNTAQIHGLFDHLVVVEDVVLRSIHRLSKPEGASQLAALGQDLQGCLLPALLAGPLEQLLRDRFGVGEVLLQLRPLLYEIPRLLLGEIVRLALVVEEYYLVCLAQGLLRFSFLLLFLHVRFLEALAGQAELPHLLQPLQLRSEQISHFVKLGLLRQLNC